MLLEHTRSWSKRRSRGSVAYTIETREPFLYILAGFGLLFNSRGKGRGKCPHWIAGLSVWLHCAAGLGQTEDAYGAGLS